ncbi:hypothetical protein GIB67_007073 [Kingdonia uniflora]|uniref:ABC1 atypical kinase-like domain-containing protein n=1 Tax=Kingdonia uniflora TaxID=39325 RepID=A0A7J7NZP5_9MAGN|nr:hypothetical protein GIB67_007073 [Kingdonia uniflora]
MKNLPKLVEDIVQTSLNTGPRGAMRLAQGIQAVIGVGGEWLSDVSKLIASAPTLFPPEYVEEFQKCFDRAPTIPFADLNFVYIVARILEFVNPELCRASMVDIIKDIKESMLEEVDFLKETANIESFRRYLEAMGLNGQATAPKDQSCSSRRVLTMERLYGVPITDLDSISSLVSNPETSLITALNVWFGSLLACETFHADVHAGNLWLLRDGRIGFLDFGIVGHISSKTWAAMEVFLASFANEDYEAMASSLIQMGATNTNPIGREIIVSCESELVDSVPKTEMEIALAEQLKNIKFSKSTEMRNEQGCYYTSVPRVVKHKGISGQELTSLNLDKVIAKFPPESKYVLFGNILPVLGPFYDTFKAPTCSIIKLSLFFRHWLTKEYPLQPMVWPFAIQLQPMTQLLESMLMKDYGGVEDLLLGELQFAFIAFLMGQSLEGFLHWKALVTLMFSCNEAFIQVIYYQLKFGLQENPTNTIGTERGASIFMDDSWLSKESFFYLLCKEFFLLVQEASVVDGSFLSW